MTKTAVWISSLVFAVLAGCGGGGGSSSPKAACEDLSASLCERFYACYSAEELASAGFPASEHECVTMFSEQQGCSTITTANACDDSGGGSYDADAASDCLDQVAGLSCSEVRDPEASLETSAPACAEVCK